MICVGVKVDLSKFHWNPSNERVEVQQGMLFTFSDMTIQVGKCWSALAITTSTFVETLRAIKRPLSVLKMVWAHHEMQEPSGGAGGWGEKTGKCPNESMPLSNRGP